MTLRRLQSLLLWMFLVFLGACCAIATWTYIAHAIEAKSLKEILLRLLTLYSVHLSVVIGGMFALKQAKPPTTIVPFAWSALALAAVWNLLIGVRCVVFAIDEQDVVTSLLDFLDSIGAASVFLVSGVVTFFFSKYSK